MVQVKCTLVQALRLCTGRTAHRVSRGIALLFLDHGTRRWWGQRHAPAAIYPQERPGTRCTGGWVDPRAVLDRCGKSNPPLGFDPRTIQPVASRYTNWATPVHLLSKKGSKNPLILEVKYSCILLLILCSYTPQRVIFFFFHYTTKLRFSIQTAIVSLELTR